MLKLLLGRRLMLGAAGTDGDGGGERRYGLSLCGHQESLTPSGRGGRAGRTRSTSANLSDAVFACNST